MQPGAASVFLDFISYSDGPLPDELLEACKRPVSILWGACTLCCFWLARAAAAAVVAGANQLPNCPRQEESIVGTW